MSLQPHALEVMGRFGVAMRSLAAIAVPYTLVLSHRNYPIVLGALALGGVLGLRRARMPAWAVCGWLFLAYAAVTTLWSPYGDAASWPPYLAATLLISTAAMYSHGPASSRWVLWALAITVLLLGIEAVTRGAIRDITPPLGRPDKDDVATARGITAMLCFAPAVAVWAWRERRRRVLAVLGVMAAWAAFSFGLAANTLAFVGGAGVAALCVFLNGPKRARVLPTLLYVAAAGFVLTPLAALLLPSSETIIAMEAGPASWRMRLLIWREMADALAGADSIRLVFGHGVEASRVLGEARGTVTLPGMMAGQSIVSTHAHNVFLQVWYDLGLAGSAIFASSLVLAGRMLARRMLKPDMTAAVAALVTVALVFASVDASLWTLWRVAGPLVGAWAVVAVTRLNRPEL